MSIRSQRCKNCGQGQPPLPASKILGENACPACDAPIDGSALSRFADRLAQFGLGATPLPLMTRVAELPDVE